MAERSQEIAADVSALLRARNPLLWIVTREEARCEQYLIEAAASAGYIARTWDCGQGVAGMDGKPLRNVGSTDPGDTLTAIRSAAEDTVGGRAERGVWILRDLPVWLNG